MGRKGNMMEQKGKMEMEDGMQERVSETEYKNSSIMVSICCITYIRHLISGMHWRAL